MPRFIRKLFTPTYVLLAAVLAMYPLYSLVAKGPFGWHVVQPGFVQGGLEVLGLFACTWAFLRSAKRWYGKVLLVIVWEFYLRRHGVDGVMLLSLLYVLGIIALGWHTLGLLRFQRRPDGATMLAAAIAGITVLGLALWSFSIAGYGSFTLLNIVTVIVLGLALALTGVRTRSIARPLDQTLSQYTPGRIESFMIALVCVTCAFTFAKSADVLGYDTLWYGLHSAQDLVGAGNIYTPQGLVAPVHYYPKLYEMLTMVLSDKNSAPLVTAASAWSGIGLALVAGMLALELGVSRRLSLLAMACVLTLPAMGTIMLTSKGDAFSALLICTSLYFLLRFVHGKDSWQALAIGLTALVLGLGGRLAHFPYIAVTGLMYVVLVLRYRPGMGSRLQPGPVVLVAAGVMVAVLVTLRTVAVSGVPFIAPQTLVDLAHAAGFHKFFYVAGNEFRAGRSHIPIFQGLYGFLIAPAQFAINRISWTGNAWFFMLCLAPVTWFISRKTPSRRPEKLAMAAVGACFPLVLFGYTFTAGRGADGSYFLAPLACLSVLGALSMHTVASRLRRRDSLALVLGVCVLCTTQAGISLLTSEWHAGTRAFDFKLDRNAFHFDRRRLRKLEKAQLDDVSHMLKSQPGDVRVLTTGLADKDVFLLPVQAEPAEIIHWANRKLLASRSEARRYLGTTAVNFIVVGHSADSRLARWVREGSAETGDTTRPQFPIVYQGQRADVYRVRHRSGQGPKR